MSEPKSKSFLFLGFIYFIGIFLLGFVLGTIRTLFLAPSFGKVPAVLMEIPIILIAAWLLSRFLLNHYRVSHSGRFLLKMGITGLCFLMLTELIISVFVFGNSMNSFFKELVTVHGILGFCGQIVFGLIPVLQKYFK
jgi:hypothetical protein